MTNSVPDGWDKIKLQPLPRAETIAGISRSHLYAKIHEGELEAVTLAGKTMVTTASLLGFLAKAKPWVPNLERIVKAVAARPDVIRKRAQAEEAERARREKKRIKETARKAARKTAKGELELARR